MRESRPVGMDRGAPAQYRNPGEPCWSIAPMEAEFEVSERRTENAGEGRRRQRPDRAQDSEQRAAAQPSPSCKACAMRGVSKPRSCQSRASRRRERRSFRLWEPRDIVGGDFFWFEPIRDGHAVIVGDWTGHGVSGAFMTSSPGHARRTLQIGAKRESAARSAGLDRGGQSLLGQDQKTGETELRARSGVCFINPIVREMTFAGARSAAAVDERGARDQGRLQRRWAIAVSKEQRA